MNRLALTAAAMLFACACSTIKEDRGPCPCRLTVVCGDEAGAGNGILLSEWADDKLYMKNVDAGDMREGISNYVPRVSVAVCAARGLVTNQIKGHCIMIPEGKGADSLRCHYSIVDCRDEFASDTARFHKQYASISLVMMGLDESGESPFVPRVEGNTCGLDMIGLIPITGSFRTYPRRVTPGVYRVEVLRQADSSLSLELIYEGNVVKELSIGQYLDRIGYSWLKEDLEDVTMTIDLAVGKLRIEVAGWKVGDSFDMEI
ncbi:MAG: hypothetical protein HUJ94_03490 [Bacteroidales bacterium]|nr:hypothetical protein [Bacteroidales bacterium]